MFYFQTFEPPVEPREKNSVFDDEEKSKVSFFSCDLKK